MSGGEGRKTGRSTGLQNSTKLPKYFREIAECISRRYASAGKIVEVGVGRSPYTILLLRELLPGAELTAVDVDEEAVEELRKMGLKAFVDDLTSPSLEIYEGADLIYSIRPPFELIPNIASLGARVGSDVLIAPLSEDAHLSDLSGWKMLRLGEAAVYILEKPYNLSYK